MNSSIDVSWSHIPARTDLGRAREALQTWLRDRRPAWHDLRVLALRAPGTTGGTGDNLLLTAQHGSAASPTEVRMVVRLAPGDSSTVHDADLGQHFRVLQALAPTAVPSPEPLWFERDGSVLGAPFMVMEQAPGQAPPDFPIYNEAGFLFDASVTYRQAAWRSAVAALAAVATVDPEPFAFLDRPDLGNTGLAQVLGYLDEAFAIAHGGDGHEPIDQLLAWLHRTPPAAVLAGVSWGDARMGNVLVDKDAQVTALLDWDRAMLGGPLVDLGWWLLFDRMHGEDYGSPRLAGLGSRAETLELWSERSGLDPTGIDWYELLAATLLAIVRLRSERTRAEQGLWTPAADNPRSVDRLVARANRMVALIEAG